MCSGCFSVGFPACWPGDVASGVLRVRSQLEHRGPECVCVCVQDTPSLAPATTGIWGEEAGLYRGSGGQWDPPWAISSAAQGEEGPGEVWGSCLHTGTLTSGPGPLCGHSQPLGPSWPGPAALPLVWVGKALGCVPLAAWSCSLLAGVRVSSPSRSLWGECTRVLGGRCMWAAGGCLGLLPSAGLAGGCRLWAGPLWPGRDAV